MSIAVLSTAHKGIPPVALVKSAAAKTSYFYDPGKPVPRTLIAWDQHAKGVLPLRKRIKSALLLDAQQGAWVLRRSVFEPILAEVTDVVLIPVEARDAKGSIDDDWILAHVTTVVSIDRKVSKLGPHPEGDSKKKQPIALGWNTAPTAAMFRLKESPWVTCASRSLFEQLHKASKRAIVEATAPYSHRQPAFMPVEF
jgi:hypothetical protein